MALGPDTIRTQPVSRTTAHDLTVVVEHLTHAFGAVFALADVSFELRPGATALLGPNGAGKTTLLRCAATVLKPDSGRITVAGHDIGPMDGRRRARHHLGYLPQQVRFDSRYTVRTHLDHIAVLRGILASDERGEAVARAAQTTRLTDLLDHRIRTLSGGMRRRLGIAQSILGEPSVLLWDEPTAGLDPQQRVTFRDTVSRLDDGNTTMLLSTHQIDDVVATCRNVIVLDGGKIRFQGGIDDLTALADGRVWLGDDLPAGSLGWRTPSGKYRVIGDPPRGAQALVPVVEDAYLWVLERPDST